MHILNSIGKILFFLFSFFLFSIWQTFDIMELLEKSLFFNRMFHENGSQVRFRKTATVNREKEVVLIFLKPFFVKPPVTGDGPKN